MLLLMFFHLVTFDDVSAFGADKGFNVFQITPLILMDLAKKTVRKRRRHQSNLQFRCFILIFLTILLLDLVTGVDYSGINNLYVQPSDQWSAVYFEDANNAGLAGFQDYDQTNILAINQYNICYMEHHDSRRPQHFCCWLP